MTLPSSTVRFFEQRSEFHAALHDMVERAESELLLFDPSFADWAIETAAFEAALIAFVTRSPNAQVRMVITEVDRINRDYARLARFLRDYSHRAECRVTPEQYASLNESLLIADRTSTVRRPITTRFRGVARVLDPEYSGAQRERFDELWQDAHARYAPTTLGL